MNHHFFRVSLCAGMAVTLILCAACSTKPPVSTSDSEEAISTAETAMSTAETTEITIAAITVTTADTLPTKNPVTKKPVTPSTKNMPLLVSTKNGLNTTVTAPPITTPPTVSPSLTPAMKEELRRYNEACRKMSQLSKIKAVSTSSFTMNVNGQDSKSDITTEILHTGKALSMKILQSTNLQTFSSDEYYYAGGKVHKIDIQHAYTTEAADLPAVQALLESVPVLETDIVQFTDNRLFLTADSAIKTALIGAYPTRGETLSLQYALDSEGYLKEEQILLQCETNVEGVWYSTRVSATNSYTRSGSELTLAVPAWVRP